MPDRSVNATRHVLPVMGRTAYQIRFLFAKAKRSARLDSVRTHNAAAVNDNIREGLRLIFAGIDRLKQAHDRRKFTIDGRLVGDIGEVIAELEYDLTLDRVSQRDHDATDRAGRRVQIKATFKDSLTFKTCPDFYLGFWLKSDGSFEEVF